MKETGKQFILYGAGGGISFLITFLSTGFLTDSVGIYYLLSSAIGYALGFLFNFLYQAFVTFQTRKERIARRAGLFAATQMGGFLLFLLLMFCATDLLGVAYKISVIISSILVMVFNFGLSKKFVFQQ